MVGGGVPGQRPIQVTVGGPGGQVLSAEGGGRGCPVSGLSGTAGGPRGQILPREGRGGGVGGQRPASVTAGAV